MTQLSGSLSVHSENLNLEILYCCILRYKVLSDTDKSFSISDIMKPSSMRFSIKYFGISNAGRSFKTSDFTWLVYAKPNTFIRKCYHSSLLVTPSWRSSWLDYKQTISGEIFWDVKLSKTLFKLSFCFWSTLSISQFAAILIIILVSTKVKSAETFWFFVRTKCFLLISLKNSKWAAINIFSQS